MNTNKVELIGTYGSDEIHALSAWTSTSRDLTPDKRERIGPFLKQLSDDGHETPFEKSFLHFLITTDIASHIHILKHRIGVSLNSESARYKELKLDKYYVPVDWPEDEKDDYEAHVKSCFDRYHSTVKRLVKKGLDRKRAKESARFYLPYGMQYTADVSFNWRSFYHFIKLRYSWHAQVEIRNIAREMLVLVAKTGLFDKTLAALKLVDENGKIVGPFGKKE